MSDSSELKKQETRGRKKKNPTPSENQNPNPTSADSVFAPESETPPDLIQVDIESHAPADSLSWTEKIKRAGERVGLLDDEDQPERIETRGRKKKTAVQDEFSTLVIAVLTLILSFANIPDQVKPNQSELTIFSNHLTGILLRHLPISNKFSADSLDIIGLFAVCSGWYARVAPEIKLISEKQKPEKINANPSTPNPSTPNPSTPAPVDPVKQLSPAAADYLASVELKAVQNARN